MKITSVIKKIASIMLLAALTLAAFGCTGTGSQTVDPTAAPHGAEATAKPALSIKTTNLMAGITAKSLEPDGSVVTEKAPKAADFAIRLMQASNESGKNTLISPLSVMSALAMTVNGAEGETLAEMERVLGMSREELNEYFRAYLRALAGDENGTLSLANSVWFTSDERFTVNRDFLQANADHFNADIYKAPFDSETLKDINAWVNDKTHGMIPEILDRLDPEDLMCLINALAFEAKWESVYEKHEVSKSEFTTESGEKRPAEFMNGTENTFLSCEKAKGFIKYYEGRRYAFAALLPNEGVSVDELIASLDGESLTAMLSGAAERIVNTKIPKFETKYDIGMNGILARMGMPTAFDPDRADFSGLGSSAAGNIYISRVVHKTFISVGEQGTRAGAATAVVLADGCAFIEDPEEIFLDRPFVYMLIDCETNLPFFIGTMMDIEG